MSKIRFRGTKYDLEWRYLVWKQAGTNTCMYDYGDGSKAIDVPREFAEAQKHAMESDNEYIIAEVYD